jgi:hypothetical protein
MPRSSKRNQKSRRRRRRRKSRRQSGGVFGAIIKEAIVPIAFLSGNVKLKKKVFGNKTVMIPIFKNMNKAKYERDKKSRKKGRRMRKVTFRKRRRRKRR